MLSMQNSKERDVDDWTGLLGQADPRFRFKGINRSPESPLVLIEAIWEDGK